MTPDRFGRLKRVVLEAADLPEDERKAYLDKVCKDDPELRKEAESILAHDTDESGIVKTDGMVPHPPDDSPMRRDPQTPSPLAGEGWGEGAILGPGLGSQPSGVLASQREVTGESPRSPAATRQQNGNSGRGSGPRRREAKQRHQPPSP